MEGQRKVTVGRQFVEIVRTVLLELKTWAAAPRRPGRDANRTHGPVFYRSQSSGSRRRHL
jgi:hypothetical protein